MRPERACLVLALCSFAVAAAEPPAELPGVVVVGERGITGIPAAAERVDADAVPARAQRSATELLRRVPGVAARDRQNYAQDLQLAIRGFGARSAFGVRGLRIYADGIPATMPDGQSQVSHVPLEAVQRVEVLRGPFSALYGNASGGVISFFSADPSPRAAAGGDVAAGSDATWRAHVWASGPWPQPRDDGTARQGYRIDAGQLRSDGYRRHSAAHRDTVQARAVFGNPAGTRLWTLTANRLDLRADDPQGLDPAQASRDPRAASAGALAFDTRKRVRQQQLGLRVEQDLDGGRRLQLGAWAGQRDTFQVLSVPVMAQASATSAGGVVDLARGYAGFDLRWTADAVVAGRAANLAVGVEAQRSDEHRRGYENFVGERLGVVGALRRDERDAVGNRDVYAELHWQLARRWSTTLGLRRSRVDFRTRDRFIAAGNPDDSGRLRYAQTTPVAGMLYRPGEHLEAFANAGRGFETPTFAELAYRSDGGSGLNGGLRPARSANAEAGVRLRARGQAIALTAFAIRTRDELVATGNLGGRSVYANAADTRRRGWELSASGPLSSRWRYALALGAIDARYREPFATCRAAPCTTPDTPVAAGNRIPGIASTAWAELRWQPRTDLDLFVQGNALARTWADDANTVAAPGHATLDLGIERRWHLRGLALEGFARIDNVLDRRVIGSVIVNDSNGRYFEPAPGRGWMLGLALRPDGAP